MKWKNHLITGAKGVLMGAADVIPGVSGGTMAFITGIYDKLIAAINSVDLTTLKLFFTGKFKQSMARIHWNFIIPLVIGVFISVISLARVITSLLSNYPVHVWSFFFGLILASIFVVIKEVKKWNLASITGLITGTTGAYFLVGMIPLSTPTNWWFTMIAGAVAIVAMILPGISGSFILVLLSQYRRILEAVKSLDLGTLIFFYIGTMIGMLGFARILGWLLSKHRNVTLAVLSGFMIGSLRKVWPFKEVLETTVIHGKTIVIKEMNILPDRFSKELILVFGLFLGGLIIVLALEMVSGFKKRGKS
jgi:putative membrane protein